MKTWIDFLKFILQHQAGEGLMSGGEGGGEGDSGGSDGDEGASTTVNSGGEGGSGDDDIAWPEGLDPVLKGDKTLLNHYDKVNKQFKTAEIMKSLVNAKKLVGSEKVPKPQKDWGQDQYNDFFRQVGLPESIDQYEIDSHKGLPEGAKPDEALIDSFKEAAYNNGVLPHQAEGLVEFFNSHQTQQNEQFIQQAKQEFEEAIMNLKQEYGDALDNKLKSAFNTLQMFATDSEIEKLRDKGLTDDPDFARILIKVADSRKENNFEEGSLMSHGGMTPQEAGEKLKDMYKQGTQKLNPKQKRAWTEEVSRLSAIKNSANTRRKGNTSAMM